MSGQENHGPDIGQLIASGAIKSGNSDVGSHHVGSSAGQPNPNAKGMGAALGAESQTDLMLKQSIASPIPSESVDGLFQGMQGALEHGIFDSLDEGNMSPFGLMKEGAVPALQSEHMNLEHVAMKTQLSAEIRGATGIASPSQGQQH